MQTTKVKTSDIYDYLDEYRSKNKKPLEEFLLELTLQKPFGDHKFYVFSFLKHNMKGFGEKTLFHQPRLTKPEPTGSSMLFRLNPNKVGDVEVMWILPDVESIELFKKGKMFEDETINSSIEQYINNRESMRAREWDDLPYGKVKEIYKDKVRKMKRRLSF